MTPPCTTIPASLKNLGALVVLGLFSTILGCGASAGSSRSDERAASAEATVIAVSLASEATQEVILWARNNKGGLSTHWLSGNRSAVKLIRSRDGLVLPVGGGVWELKRTDEEIALCDCEAWSATDMEEPCPPSGEYSLISHLSLVNLSTGEERPVLSSPSEEDGDAATAYVRYDADVSITASVGPYLFVRWGEESLACGAAHDSWMAGFSVLDARTGEEVDIFTEEEAAALAKNEQLDAYELVRQDNLVVVDRPEDLTLTAVEPVLLPGLGITFKYQFTADASFADSDGNWSSYSRSIKTNAKTIPEIFEPYALLPPALLTFAPPARDTSIGGWIPIDLDGENLRVLLGAFGVEIEEK